MRTLWPSKDRTSFAEKWGRAAVFFSIGDKSGNAITSLKETLVQLSGWCIVSGSHSFATRRSNVHYGISVSLVEHVFDISLALTWLCCLSLILSLSLSHRSLWHKTTGSNENAPLGCRGLVPYSIAALFVCLVSNRFNIDAVFIWGGCVMRN